METADRWKSAAAAKIRLVRLVSDKWKGRGRDFLIGNADGFLSVVPEDLTLLRRQLDLADQSGIKVIVGMLSPPGARWVQNNGGKQDCRLYRSAGYQEQAAEFRRQLARSLKWQPAIVAHDVVNEPHPDRAKDAATKAFDLSGFYGNVVKAIRESDTTTPIVLEAGDYASPEGLGRLIPLADPKVVYSFHFYEPWEYIDHQQKGFEYPGPKMLEGLVAPVLAWQKRHGIASNRVFVGEFGCSRTHPGAGAWLRDAMALFDRHGWHWAFYSFREDTWQAMDYELGVAPLPAGFLAQQEKGLKPTLDRRPNPLWKAIREGLARP